MADNSTNEAFNITETLNNTLTEESVTNKTSDLNVKNSISKTNNLNIKYADHQDFTKSCYKDFTKSCYQDLENKDIIEPTMDNNTLCTSQNDLAEQDQDNSEVERQAQILEERIEKDTDNQRKIIIAIGGLVLLIGTIIIVRKL